MTKREKIEKLMEQFNSTHPYGDSFDLAEFMYDKGYVDGYEAEADVRDNED